MVALSSSSSTSVSSIDSPSYLRLPSLEEILEDAQSHFPRFLFDSEPLAVLELLNSLLIRCSERGYSAVLECLWCWQDLSDFSHSLSPLLDELRCANDVQIVIASLRLLERLLQFAPDRVSRARLRNEMEELHVEEIIVELRERFKSSKELEEPINDWMNALKLQSEKSEEEMLRKGDADSGTFSDSEDIGESSGENRKKKLGIITENGKEMAEFQKLLTELSDNERNEILTLLRKLISQMRNKGSNLNEITASLSENNNKKQPSPPAPPPPPPPNLLKNVVRTAPNIKVEDTTTTKKTLPPPPPLLMRPLTPGIDTSLGNNPPTQAADIPRPLRPKALPGQGRRLRHLQWSKVPSNAVVTTNIVMGSEAASSGHQNVWQGLDCADRELRDRLDFVGLDSLFGCPSSPPAFYDNEQSPSFMSTGQKRRRAASLMPNSQQQDFIALLNAKRSLSVNVFLKMRNSEQLLCDITNGNAEKIGADRLRTLIQLLPSDEEQEIFGQYNGDFAQLGQAERFLILLTQVPKYKMRIDAMLFRLDIEELINNSGQNCGLETWLKGGEELMSSPSLHKILYILLHVGNYLNHGAGIGNAVGFRLSSLWKVEDVKAVGGVEKGRRSTLLHFVAKQANNCAEELVSELGNVRESVKTSLEATKEDLRGLIERQRRLEGEIKEIQNNDIFFGEYKQFLEKSGNFLKRAENQMGKFEPLRQRLANFFCEPERTFSLEECFKIISSFIERFEKAVQENRQWSLDNGIVKTTLNPTEINRSTSPKPSIHLNDNSPFLSNFVKNTSLGVPLGAESLRRRRNSALPAFELKNEEEKKQGNDVKISENTSNPPLNITQPQKHQTLEDNSNNEVNNPKLTTQDNALNQPNNPPEPLEEKIKIPPSSPALFRLSRDAKQRLADIDKKKEIKNNKLGQVAKRIDHYEHQGLQKPQQRSVSGISRLSSISKVRTGQMTAVIQVKGNLENNNETTGIQRPTPFRRNQTLTPTSCRNLSSKIASNVEKQKEALQNHKSKLHSSPLTRASSQQVSNISKRQHLQASPKSNNSSPVAKSKPVLTRQVSTASRPILINTSGGGNSNNNNNNANPSSSDKKPWR
ncbi:hypothetical protein ACQ4LE_006302 [Meloidogyne hapla]